MTRAVSRPRRGLVAICRWATVGIAAAAGLIVLPAANVRTASVSLVEPVVGELSSANRQALLGPSRGRRSQLVRVNLAPLPTPGTTARPVEDDLELTLFPGLTVNAVFDTFDTVGGSGTWVGHLEGVPHSSVTLAYRGGLLSANINTRDGLFRIQPAPDPGADDARPLHIVSEVDTTQLPRGGDSFEAPPGDVASDEPRGRQLDSGEVIDLMVVYTPTVMARNGGPAGIANLIAMQVADTNAAFANSRMRQRIRLVHSQLVPYDESPMFGRNLADLRDGVGGLSGVAALRDAHGADLVSMQVALLPGADACGVAYLSVLPGQGQRLGVSVLGDTSCPSVYVMAHELGHNFGARHDWYVDTSVTPYPFAHGYVDPAARWRTILAYEDLCFDQGFRCPRINYFSTPEIDYLPFCSGQTFNCDLLRYWFYPGRRIGVPEQEGAGCRLGVVPATPCAADNRRVISDTAFTVANYRQSR